MNLLQKLYGWYGKRTVYAIIAVAVILIIIALSGGGDTDVTTNEEDALPLVTVATPASLTSDLSFGLIGTVTAKTQAQLQAERTGRVVSVNVELGDSIGAGTVIAQLENAAERAALVQAEGSYEAAQAAAAQSGVSVTEAQNSVASAKQNAISSFDSAYTTVNSTLVSSIDQFFSNPESTVPGLLLDGAGYTTTLNNERVAFTTIMKEWQSETVSLDSNDDLASALSDAKARTERMLAMVDIFIEILQKQGRNDNFTDAQYQTFQANFNSSRSSLVSTINAINGAQTALVSAEEGLRRAEIGGGSEASSAAAAQVKQALGALMSAQANYAKTVVRSPIAGTVNSLAVRAGDYVNAGAAVAQIANNRGLEVTTYIAESQRDQVSIGQTVKLEGGIDGIVTNISPAIDPVTKKVEVRIGVDSSDLKTGSTVNVELTPDTTATAEETTITIPLSAVRFIDGTSVVYEVKDGALSPIEVTLGNVTGDMVVIEHGISNSTEIVVDARGKTAGEKVTVVTK